MGETISSDQMDSPNCLVMRNSSFRAQHLLRVSGMLGSHINLQNLHPPRGGCHLPHFHHPVSFCDTLDFCVVDVPLLWTLALIVEILLYCALNVVNFGYSLLIPILTIWKCPYAVHWSIP